LAAVLATWIGNVVGAMVMYAAGRRWGTAFLDRWLRRSHTSEKHEHRLELLYQRYGLLALGVSRFIPGVRALVPPFAGAMRLGAVKVLLVVAIPSGVWYGLVTYLAFTVGTKLDAAVDSVKSAQLWTTVVALVLVGGLVGLWLLAKRRRSRL
jgi:membrane protein DedA with SNARE-associated domain